MLVEKDKLKQKMVEYISNQFWMHDRNPTFTEIYEQFKVYISKGGISNYLDELVSEKKLVRLNSGNNVFYSRPKIHIATKYLLLCVILTILSTLFSLLLFKLYSPLLFGLGCIFSAIFWRFWG